MPDGASCLTAPNPQEREMPKGANEAHWSAVLGISRLEDVAPSGIWRRKGFRAVRHFAPLSRYPAIEPFPPFPHLTGNT
jgi:hypothetical protein